MRVVYRRGGGGRSFPWMMYGFCSNNTFNSVSFSSTVFTFLLTPFNTCDCYYFKVNLSLLMYVKKLLTKKHIILLILFSSLVNMKKQLFLMHLFLCWHHISIFAILSKNVKSVCVCVWGGGGLEGWEKRYKGGMNL